jgi:hypothetical protein
MIPIPILLMTVLGLKILNGGNQGNWNEHVYAVIGESNLGTDGPGRCTSFKSF